MNFAISSDASSIFGASFTSSSVMFVMCVMNSGIFTPGFMNVWNVSVLPSRSNLMAPNSVIWSFLLSKPVVSRSRDMNMGVGFFWGGACFVD